jgi:septal ring factor EnvC (AmiA/AmiB activator)
MNIRMLTPAERERLAYIEDHPDKELLGELVDTERRLNEAENDLFETEQRLEEAEDRIEYLEAE